MNNIITDVRGKSWITRHNTNSMLRSLFMGKVWKWKEYNVVIRETDKGWTFGCLAAKDGQEVIIPLDMTINEFIGIMSNENVLFE